MNQPTYKEEEDAFLFGVSLLALSLTILFTFAGIAFFFSLIN